MRRTRTRSSPLLPTTFLVVVTFACASVAPQPPRATVDRARAADSYGGSLRVSLKGQRVRARTRALVAFRRPGDLRIEIPGPAGVRLIAVASGDALTAVFPGERAVFTGRAAADDLDALLGVALTPSEVMDLLVGAPPPQLKAYQARWGPLLPEQISATLADDTRLKLEIEQPELSPPLPLEAFADPPHEGYRPIGADEARELLGRR